MVNLLDKFIQLKKRKKEDDGGLVEEVVIDAESDVIEQEAKSSDGMIVGFSGLEAVAAATDTLVVSSEKSASQEVPPPESATANEFAFELGTPEDFGIDSEAVKKLSGAIADWEM